MACANSRPRCPLCNDTDCVCPPSEYINENPPTSCPFCGDTDCVCPDAE